MDKVSCVTPYHTKKYLLPYGDIMHEHDITESNRHDSCIGKLRRICRVKQTKPTTHGRHRLHMVVMMIKYLKDLEVHIYIWSCPIIFLWKSSFLKQCPWQAGVDFLFFLFDFSIIHGLKPTSTVLDNLFISRWCTIFK